MLAGLGGLFGVATLTTKPALFLALGCAVFALVYIRLYAERPEAFVAAVTAFLDGRALPFPLKTRSRLIEGYRGPTGDAR